MKKQIMRTLITTYTVGDKNTVKLLYAILGARIYLISQDYDSEKLRTLAKKYGGYDSFELRSGRGRILEKWEYIRYVETETL